MSNTTSPLYLRDIGRAISDELQKDSANDVHWLAVTGENSMDPHPTRVWTEGLADSVLQVAVRRGNSEGMMLYVQALSDRYDVDKVETIFSIKLLCSQNQSHLAARDLTRFLESKEFEALVQGRASKHQDNSRRIYKPAATASPEAERFAKAKLFFKELQDSVETIAGIAENHGNQTLADLMYLYAAILTDEQIDGWQSQSAAQSIAEALPSSNLWLAHIVQREEADQAPHQRAA